jgi:Ca2+/Na+ antiporter
MGNLGLVHPALLSSLPDHFHDTCTVQEATETRGSNGAVLSAWGNLAAHVNLVCIVAPVSAHEQHRAKDTITIGTHKAMLAGYYPAITEKMQLVAGGATYDIVGVWHDSLAKATHLDLQVIR